MSMKKILCLYLSLLMAVPLLCFNLLNVQASVDYQYVKIDDSKTYEGGTFKNYFVYPELQGSSKAIKKINNALKKEGKKHVKVRGYSIEEIQSFIEHDYENYQTKCDYYNIAKGKAAFNDQDVFSIRFTTEWFAGGVANGDVYGETFDTTTGKRLNLTQVIDSRYTGYSALSNALYKKLKKKYDQETADNFLNNYDSAAKLKKADFYLTTTGNLVVCFPTYDISYGAAGCLTVNMPSKF